jgi:RNA polymerase sigma factor (sigma-70 family)
MNPSDSITEWAAKLPAGNVPRGQDKATWRAERDEAFQRLYERFHRRVLGLVRRILSESIRRRVDEEDVAQSAFDGFVRGQERATSPLANREDVWRVLATIARRRAINLQRYHGQARRDLSREEFVCSGSSADSSNLDGRLEDARARASPPDTNLIANETIAWLIEALGHTAGAVAVLRAEGYTVAEIAAELHLSKRSIDLKLQIIRDELAKVMAE